MRTKLESWIRDRLRHFLDSFFCSSSPDVRRVGDIHSGWVIHTRPLPRTAYCAGVGQAMSFEIELAKMSAGCVLVFDPSPTGIKTAANSDTSLLKFYPVGIAATSDTYEFSPPEKPGEGSYSVTREGAQKVSFDCWSIQAIMAKHGHADIDLLKMDIEGFEYDILDHVVGNSIPIRQICVEFHPWLRPGRTLKTVRKLQKAGYRIIHKQRGNYTFLRGK